MLRNTGNEYIKSDKTSFDVYLTFNTIIYFDRLILGTIIIGKTAFQLNHLEKCSSEKYDLNHCYLKNLLKK